MAVTRRRDLDDVELADTGGALRDEWERAYRTPNQQPERRLQIAVLEDAFRILARDARGYVPWHWRNARAETLAWVERDDDGPFAFVTICESLEVDVGMLRARLVELTAAPSVGVRKQFRLLTHGRHQQPLSTGGNWHGERAARRARAMVGFGRHGVTSRRAVP